jgi:hypothetical protein
MDNEFAHLQNKIHPSLKRTPLLFESAAAQRYLFSQQDERFYAINFAVIPPPASLL